MRSDLLGIGLYTPADATRLLGIPASKVRRWLCGHSVGDRHYPALWLPQIDLGDGSLHLGFRDLMELRTAHAFMDAGVSAQQIRRAITESRKYINDERPLSTTLFRTDGRNIFLEIASQDDDVKLINLFGGQFVFKKIIDRSLRDVDFEGISPARWWINSNKDGIVIDPKRSFGQPIDSESGVPTSVLANAAKAEKSARRAADVWRVSEAVVRRAVEFESKNLDLAA